MARKPLRAQDPEAGTALDPFEAIGGSAKCLELAAAFYSRVDHDPTLRPLFPGKTHRCAIEAFAAFLVQFLGGPPEDTQHRWWLSLGESHTRFQIGQKERDAWMAQMTRVLREVEMSDPMREALQELFSEAATYLVNSGPAVVKTEIVKTEIAKTEIAKTGCPSEHSGVRTQVRHRWQEQLALDDAVAAVRQGDLPRVIALVEGPLLQSRFQRSRAVFAQFIGVLVGCGRSVMAEYAQRTLLANPDLAHVRYSGRTLLHAASAAGNLAAVTALLKIGIDPNIQDWGGHTPLYSVGNACPGGGPVVRTLIRSGAKADACDGVKRCTALHMAARRDNVEVAEALLECGADIEARDSLGETPLRRAVNCGQTRVAALLLAKGADRHSVGRKGLTPVSAARSGAMRNLLQTTSQP